jgi:hypothetical protein
MLFSYRIFRNAKDTAHTKAERNILECVKVNHHFLSVFFLNIDKNIFSVRLLLILRMHFKQVENYI